MQKLISKTDLAKEVGVTQPAVHYWIDKGIIPAPTETRGCRVYWRQDQLPELLAMIQLPRTRVVGAK